MSFIRDIQTSKKNIYNHLLITTTQQLIKKKFQTLNQNTNNLPNISLAQLFTPIYYNIYLQTIAAHNNSYTTKSYTFYTPLIIKQKRKNYP